MCCCKTVRLSKCCCTQFHFCN